MSRVNFKEVSRFGDEIIKLQIFARSFDHNIDPFGSARIYELNRGDTTFGYADVIYLPVVFPAFHPEITRPRDVTESIDGWKKHCQIAHGGEGLMAVPLDSERKTFPTEMLEKQGFSRMKREIYALNVEA
jgi:hypothetical protein